MRRRKVLHGFGHYTGMHMALCLISERFVAENSDVIAKYTEYTRSADATNDTFAR